MTWFGAVYASYKHIRGLLSVNCSNKVISYNLFKNVKYCLIDRTIGFL